MTNVAEYILQLQSRQFESGMASAIGSTNALDSSFSRLKSSALSFVGAFASYSFIEGSVSAFNEAAQASAQLDATLRSTSNAANLNRKALDEQAEALMQKSLYDDDAITKTQALLATFTNVKDAIYMEAIPAIVDMSTKLGGDLQGSAIQVGKALNDPVKGITALQRAGVSFSESQKKTIEQLVATNRVAEAQAMILRELQTEFGGSALAASEAGTGGLTVLRNEFGNVREELGALVVSYINEFKPAISDFIKALRDGIKWVTEHKTEVKALAVGFVAMRTAASAGSLAISSGLIPSLTGATSATTALAGASTALVAALGAVAIAVGAIAYAYVIAIEKTNAYYANSREQKALNAYAATDTDARLSQELVPGLMNLKEGLQKKGVSGQALYDQMYSARKQDLEMRQSALTSQLENAKNRTEELEIQKKLTDLGNQERLLTNMYADKFGNVMGRSSKPATALGTASASSKAGGAKPAKMDRAEIATGRKSITFNIQIQDIVKQFTVNTNGVREASGKIRNVVVDALMSSINDFQRAVPE